MQTQSSSLASSGTPTQQTSTPPGYVLIGPASGLAGKSYAYFSHPSHGVSILVNLNGTWMAFSAVCTHALHRSVCRRVVNLLSVSRSHIQCKERQRPRRPRARAARRVWRGDIGGNVFVTKSRINQSDQDC